jgi:putative membrane protein
MGKGAGRLFSAADLDSITAAVQAAEAGTSGEIAVVIAPHSRSVLADHWLQAAIWSLLASVATLVLTRYDDWGAYYRFSQAALVGLAVFGLALVIFYVAATRPRQMARACWRSAMKHFERLEPTRAQTAVLIFMSIAERQAVVIADRAIASKLPPEYWHKPQGMIARALRDRRPMEGIEAALSEIGTQLAQFFPRSPDDVNELPDRPTVV